MRKLSIFFMLLLFAGFTASAQMQITGKVTNAESGSPIPGVSIVVKSQTTIGTTSDMDGNYSIEVPSDAESLVFSFVGMQTKQVSINGRSTIDVQLKPQVREMEQVVVTALGISREKKNLGYSVQDVGGEELTKAQQSDAISALQGRVSGVQVRASGNMGGSSNILIRGATSITGNSNPLIVVDGVPIDNSNYNTESAQAGYGGYDYGNMLNDINPDEIKSMSVLKGAAAALYGSRAANGVILIETKSGQTGKEDFSVEVNSSVNFNQVYLLPELQNKYGGGAIANTQSGFDEVSITNKNTGETGQYLVPDYAVDESWGPRYDADTEVLHWDAFSPNSYPDQYLNPRPWTAPEHGVKDFYDMGVSFKNNIGVTKTGEDYSVRFSYSNANTDGKMPGSEQNKNNFKLAAQGNLTDQLTVKADLKYMDHYTKGRPQVGYGSESVGQKFFQWGQRQLDYERLEEYKENDGDQRTWNRKEWDNPTPKYSDNPYWTAYENYPEDTRTRFIGSLGVSYDFLDHFKAEANVYGDTYNFYQRERRTIGSQAQPYYSEMVRKNTEFNYEGRLSYNQEFGEFSVNTLLGANRRDVRYDSNYGETQGGLVVPGVYSLTNSTDDPSLDDYTREKRVNSMFLQGSFNYGGFANLEASIRNDWSSTLPEDKNSYMYYGFSGSFIFSELMDVDWLSLGKLRAGYTQVGNDTDPYRVRTSYSYNTDGAFGGAPRLFIGNGLANKNLEPEITTTTEGGLDLSLFQDRINLSATYFNKATENLIIPLEVAKGSGYESKTVNAGELVSKGLEFQLSGTPVRTEDFNWNISLNLTSTKMVVEELMEGIDAIDIVRAPFGGVFLRASEGDEYGQLWGTDYIYDENGNKVINNATGTYAATKDLEPLGSVYPDYNLGVRNSLSYKNWDFSFLIDIQQGGKFYSLSHMWGMYSGMLEATAQVNDNGNNIREPVSEDGGILLDGVRADVSYDEQGELVLSNVQENETYTSGKAWSKLHYHGFGTPSAQSTFDASYVKIREATLGYTFKKELFGGFVKRMRISAYGRNLFTFGLDMKGFDPEMTVVGSGNIQGIDGGLQPMSRRFGMNLQLTF